MKNSLLILACAFALCADFACAQSVTITATDADAAETLPGQPANPGNIRLARTGSTTGALTVWVKVSGLAVQGEDYTFGSGPIGAFVVIPAGSAALDIAVNVIDDFLTEGAEDVRIKIDTKTAAGANVPYTISGSDRAIVNIADNEDPLAPLRTIVTLSTVNASTRENSGATNPIVFRVSRSNNLVPALSVRYSLGGTAVAGTDFVAPPATITIPANVAYVDVPLVPVDNSVVNPDRTITFTVLPTDIVTTPSPAEAYVLGAAITGTATIINDDLPPAPVVTVTSPGPGSIAIVGKPFTASFTASVADGYITSYFVSGDWGAGGAGGATNLPASTPAGTPFAGSASMTFGTAYATSHVTVTVTASNGRTTTSAPVGVWVSPPIPPPPPAPHVPVINIYALDAEGAEVSPSSGLAPNPASFRVTHSFPASATVGFLFQMGGTAKEGVDYTLSAAGTMTSGLGGRWFTFPAGTTETVIYVSPIDDLLVEGTETVTMSFYTPPFIGFNEGVVSNFALDWQAAWGFLWGPNYAASATILDNDTAPPPFSIVTIAATDASGTETTDGSDPAVFTITRTGGPLDVPLTVHYALTVPPKQTIYVTEVRPTMAQNGADFPTLPGTVTIPAGAASVDLVVVPTYDRIVEADELLQITLLPAPVAWPDPAGYAIDTNITADVTLHDAALPAGASFVWLSVTDFGGFRDVFPGRTASFAVNRSGDLTQTITVPYTIGGTAVNGVDYVALPGFVTLPAGAASMSILIDPYPGSIGSTFYNPVETVSLSLQPAPAGVSPVPYFIGTSATQPSTGGVYILDHLDLSPKQRALILRRRHLVVPIPPVRPAPALVAGKGVAAAAAAPQVWAVEASTDLVNWEFIGNTDPSGENGDFVDVSAGDFPARFYRFRPLP